MDAGCGSGQCTDSLAPHFNKILASDISAGQIEVAKSTIHPSNIEFRYTFFYCFDWKLMDYYNNIKKRRGPAEKIEVETGLAQLVNASQAAHYFDLPAFFKEADRALCKNGIVAISGADFKWEFDHGPIISEELSRLINNVLIHFLHSINLKDNHVYILFSYGMRRSALIARSRWVSLRGVTPILLHLFHLLVTWSGK